KIADLNAPPGQTPAMAPPLRADDQILPHIRCQLDEQWFVLTKETLREALHITPVNNNQAFYAPPSIDGLVDFVNQLGYPKLVAHDLLSLQKHKKTSHADQYIFQRRVSEPTRSSRHDESPYALLGQSDSEEESEKVVLRAEEGGQDEVLASNYSPPPEDTLLAQTGDMATFIVWFFKRRGDRSAVRTHMRILSVVRIEVFFMYGYDYMKKIVLHRADLNEHVIAERDFKYLYPSDFEDLYLLNLQGHLNHLPPKDKKILTTAVNQWTRQLVIRQRVEDFQLGIKSYQTQDESKFKYEVLDHEGRGWEQGIYVRYSAVFEGNEDLPQPGKL
nr:hypothetical protein [Tanacetum cinerariifolium]